ncbi:MAG TPA: lipopolysaccharide biosynthesis protein [Thiolapillus brandeum]|uniref:Lipopolysaccharide biosynthesis protein n=1 Tax=Thiolapillus brandeum TaxID=1076588 RepID=A0A7C5N7S7_9GAMM|nr:lipopolysaccharide biosynthesis protein [Thiolapillus brandeum]
MEEANTLDLAHYLDVLRRRRRQFIVPALITFVLFVLLALLIPSTYRSTATILIEQQEIPHDLVRSTVTSFADRRIQTISQRVMTTANLGKIIEKYDLYPDERRRYTLATVVEEMRDDIELKMISADVVDPRSGRPTEATIAFSLSYENESPEKAQKVANELTSLFLNENIKERRQVAREASRFLTEETDKLARQIDTLEARLADFKRQHGDNLPELQAVNREFLHRAEDRMLRTEQDLRAVEERIYNLQGQLAQVSPYSDFYSSTGKRVLSAADRLKELESQYATIVARYAKGHPTRVAMERELAALRAEVGGDDPAELQRRLTELEGELASLRKRYSADHPDVKAKVRAIAELERQLAQARKKPAVRRALVKEADNPAYIQLQSALESAQAERRSLLKTRTEVQKQIERLQKLAAEAPRVEREYREITREYDNAVLKYKELKNKQIEAQLAESLETESKGERFVVVEPPLLPEEPASPNRLAILLIGFVLSLGVGAANVGIRETLDKSVHGSRDLIEATGSPPLAVIPRIETDSDRRSRILRRLLAVLLVLGLIAAALAVVHFAYRPLDVLYYQALNRLGI